MLNRLLESNLVKYAVGVSWSFANWMHFMNNIVFQVIQCTINAQINFFLKASNGHKRV